MHKYMQQNVKTCMKNKKINKKKKIFFEHLISTMYLKSYGTIP